MSQYNIQSLQTVRDRPVTTRMVLTATDEAAFRSDVKQRVDQLRAAAQAHAGSQAGSVIPRTVRGQVWLDTASDTLKVDPDGSGPTDALFQASKAGTFAFAVGSAAGGSVAPTYHNIEPVYVSAIVASKVAWWPGYSSFLQVIHTSNPGNIFKRHFTVPLPTSNLYLSLAPIWLNDSRYAFGPTTLTYTVTTVENTYIHKSQLL